MSNKTALQITRVRNGVITHRAQRDYVVTEEPLEIRLIAAGVTRKLAITMRTPGADFELVAGFLLSEGIIHHRDDVIQMNYCVDEIQQYNVINVQINPEIALEWDKFNRNFVVSSACGVCGKASIEALEQRGLQPITSSACVSTQTVTSLTDKLRKAQQLFESTGGLHAAALFDLDGELITIREDVGRHNAMDKLLGWALLSGKSPLDNYLILVSGRASFELIQKAVSSQIPIFCAISAPSSLAVDLARKFGMTLIGFLRNNDFNIYCGQNRIQV